MLGHALAIERAMPRMGEASARAAEQRFVRENHGFVTRALWSRGTPRSHLDDAVQQVFLVALPKLPEIREARPFLYAVAVRVAKEQIRSGERHALSSDPEASARLVSRDPAPEELLDRKQRRALLDEALESLPEDVRSAFVLFELEDMTLKEIARAMAVPQGTVASRVRRGRELFREAAARLRARCSREEAR
jgi:RNA polymerase sigma-70 factor (ECF subfamily)